MLESGCFKQKFERTDQASLTAAEVFKVLSVLILLLLLLLCLLLWFLMYHPLSCPQPSLEAF